MTKSPYLRIFYPRKTLGYSKPGNGKTLEQIFEEEGNWPDVIMERWGKLIPPHYGNIPLDAHSSEVAELIQIFEKEKGFKPFSYLEGRYKYSKTKWVQW